MISIQTQLSKKLPIPGSDYSSQQASITISSECSDPSQVVAEAARLYALAEKAVDAQLAGATPVASPNTTLAPAHRPTPAQQYRGQRRQPAPISPAQARYLGQLGERAPAALAEALAQHGVTTIDALAARDASQIIDRMLQVAA